MKLRSIIAIASLLAFNPVLKAEGSQQQGVTFADWQSRNNKMDAASLQEVMKEAKTANKAVIIHFDSKENGCDELDSLFSHPKVNDLINASFITIRYSRDGVEGWAKTLGVNELGTYAIYSPDGKNLDHFPCSSKLTAGNLIARLTNVVNDAKLATSQEVPSSIPVIDQALRTFPHPGPVEDIEFIGNRHIVSSCSDGKVRLWDINTQTCVKELQVFAVPENDNRSKSSQIVCSADNKSLYVSSGNNMAVLSLPDLQKIKEQTFNDLAEIVKVGQGIFAIDVQDTDKKSSTSITINDLLQSKSFSLKFGPESPRNIGMVLSPDFSIMLGEGAVCKFDKSGNSVWSKGWTAGDIKIEAVIPIGHERFFAGGMVNAAIYDSTSGDRLFMVGESRHRIHVPNNEDPYAGVATAKLSADSKYLVISSRKWDVVWIANTKDGSVSAEYWHDSNRSVAISPDNSLIASGGGSSVLVWKSILP